jgi:hypothetical protein
MIRERYAKKLETAKKQIRIKYHAKQG